MPTTNSAFQAQPLEAVSTKSFTTNLIDSLSAKVLAVASLLIAAEMFFNFWSSQSHYLNPFWGWFFMVLVLAANLAMFVGSWVGNFAKLSGMIFAIVVLLTMCTWGLQLQLTEGVIESETPWIYEALGIAGIASALAMPTALSVAYQVAVPLGWVILRESTTASQFERWDSAYGAVYVFLFTISVSSLIWLLRSSAKNADLASQKAAEAAAESARVDAIERERHRIDALVHDQVLTTLLLAASAKNQKEAEHVKVLAEGAIEKLISFSSLQVNDDSPITVSSLFEALKKTAQSQVPDLQIDMGATSDLEVPGEVAAAISEATIQALTNSVQHAGRGVTRELVLRNHTEGIKVVVIDNGKGFRESRVPKHRLGIQLSMRSRMEQIGGTLKINSKPNQGCTVILQWSQE
jgi:signal transduction histidine kinase